MREDTKSRVAWTFIIISAALLLWGWSIAIQNLIHGTTVVS